MGLMVRWAALFFIFTGTAMPQDVSRPLADLYDRYLAERAVVDPEWGTSVGIHDHDGRLTRYDDDSWKAALAVYGVLSRHADSDAALAARLAPVKGYFQARAGGRNRAAEQDAEPAAPEAVTEVPTTP